jgi:hypothetical protein
MGLKKMADAKMGASALSWLRGLGFAAKSPDAALRKMDATLAARDPDLLPKAYQKGAQFFDRYFAPTGVGLAGAVDGYHRDGLSGALEGMVKGAAVGYGGKKVLGSIGKRVIAPAAFKVLSSGNVPGMAQAIDHAAQVAKGSKLINDSLDDIFSASGVASQSLLSKGYGVDRLKKDLDDFLGSGGMTETIKEDLYNAENPPAPFAKGGEVKPVPAATNVNIGVETHYPAQNMLLSAARGRISNYLKNLRPSSDVPRLPFDSKPDQRKQKKTYDRALDIAISPLSVMKEIKRGTIEPDHIKHLNGMYPELVGLIQKRVTEKVMNAQMDEKKPPRHVRQGLSMLLGAPLSAEMTPQSIQAAQSVFKKGLGQPQTGPQPPPKSGSKKALSKSEQAYLTGPQARQARSQQPL